MQPTLSVIIPAYNVEKYLSECLDSIVKQDNGRIEVILVNDGSTDSTWDVCCQYAEKYDYIKIFTQRNSGQSTARNFAIKKAVGEYLFFLDSDDYITSNGIEMIFEEIGRENSDVIIYLYNNFNEITNEIYGCGYHLDKETVASLNGEDLLRYLITGRIYDWYPWLVTIKREYLLKNSLFFKDGVTFEDARWTPTVLYKADKVTYIDFPIHVYRRSRNGSTTATFSKKNFLSKLGVFEYIDEFSSENNLCSTTKEMMYANMSNLYVSALFDTWSLEKEERKKYLKQLKKYKFILAKSARTYHHLLNVMWSVIGITAVSYILYLRAQWVRKKV